MLTRLKFSIVTLLAGWLLVSCSSDGPDTSSCEMKFDIYSLTSRSVTNISNITEKPFAIFGDMIPSESADNPSARTVVYNNIPITYINSAWTAPVRQYWFNNHIHSFVAVHPASIFAESSAATDYQNSRLSFTYTLPSDHKQTTDILSATHRRMYIDNREFDSNGQIPGTGADIVFLRFAHLLSQINLVPALVDNIMDDDSYIEFRSLELSGYKTKATFDIFPATLLTAAQTDDNEINVSSHAGEGSLKIDFPTPVKIVNHQPGAPLFSADEALIMLPQSFTADSGADIVLTYTINNDPTIKTVTLPLSNQQWASGKSYTYRFTIDRTGPHFGSTSITDWDVLNVGNIDVH